MIPEIAFPAVNMPVLLLVARATIILIAALALTLGMQRGSAGARHIVWLVALATLLLVPAVTAWVPPLRLAVLPPVTEVVASASNDAPRQLTVAEPAAVNPLRADRIEIGAADPVSDVAVSKSSVTTTSGLSLAFALWAIVALAITGWLAYGAITVYRIVRRATPLDSDAWLTPVYEVADRLELENIPRMLVSSDARMPFACGLFHPTIVLPADCDSWTADRRKAVLLHELAHVKRRDLVGHTLGRIACAVYWFHPLVWTAAKRLRNESERACDDLAIASGARASDYAEHLLDIVTSVRRDSTPAVALAMARRKEFEGRILAILDPELRRTSPSRGQSVALVASLVAIALVVGAASPAPREMASVPEVAARSGVVASQVASAVASADTVDKAYTSWPADPEIDRDNDKSIDRSIGPTVNQVMRTSINQSIDGSRGEAIGRSIGIAIGRDVSRAITSATVDVVGQSVRFGIGDFVKSTVNGVIGETFSNGKQVKNDERADLLVKVLKTDGDATLRRTAAWGLREYADTRVADEALSEALRKDSDERVREMAAWSLGDGNGTATSSAALSAAVRGDASESVRATAAWSLGRIDNDGIAGLISALSDKSYKVRSRAVWAIGQLEPNTAPPALIAMLRDPDARTRELTAWALFRIEDPAAVPALNDAIKRESDQKLQIAYIKALAATSENSIDALRPLLTSSDPEVKNMAVRALAGGKGAGPWPWPWPQPRPFP